MLAKITRQCIYMLLILSLLLAVLLVLMPVPVSRAENWSTLDPENSPDKRCGHSMIDIAGKVYLFGGGDVCLDDSEELYNALWKYDLALDTWYQEIPANDPPPARRGHAAWASNDKIFIHGGRGANGQALNDLWSYDPTVKSWEEIETAGPKPAARSAHTAAVIADGSAVIIGGIGSTGVRLEDTWLLDCYPEGGRESGRLSTGDYLKQTCTWEQGAPPPAGFSMLP